jgi:hypothetical protein
MLWAARAALTALRTEASCATMTSPPHQQSRRPRDNHVGAQAGRFMRDPMTQPEHSIGQHRRSGVVQKLLLLLVRAYEFCHRHLSPPSRERAVSLLPILTALPWIRRKHRHRFLTRIHVTAGH